MNFILDHSHQIGICVVTLITLVMIACPIKEERGFDLWIALITVTYLIGPILGWWDQSFLRESTTLEKISQGRIGFAIFIVLLIIARFFKGWIGYVIVATCLIIVELVGPTLGWWDPDFLDEPSLFSTP